MVGRRGKGSEEEKVRRNLHSSGRERGNREVLRSSIFEDRRERSDFRASESEDRKPLFIFEEFFPHLLRRSWALLSFSVRSSVG